MAAGAVGTCFEDTICENVRNRDVELSVELDAELGVEVVEPVLEALTKDETDDSHVVELE